jgi:PAS domain S-box-containing protein
VSEDLNEYIYVFGFGDNPGFRFVSSAFERIWQRSSDVLNADGTWLEFIHPQDRKHLEEVFTSHKYIVEGVMDEQYRILRPDGSVRWLHVRSKKYFDESGNATCRIGIGADVTEKKEGELALLQSNRLLEERHRELECARCAADAANQAKSDFLAALSHEIRTPVNGIFGAATLLRRSSLTSAQQEYGAIISDCCAGLLALLDDVLDFRKIESGRIELVEACFSVHDLLRQTVGMFRIAAAANNTSLSFELNDDVPQRLCGDATRIRQVLINLIGNAVKFTQAGFVSVRVECATDGLFSGADVALRFSIVDSGIGISREKISVIFEPFVQAETLKGDCRSGVGLGLSIVDRLVSLMGGKVVVDSEVGRGSSFVVLIPLRLAESSETALLQPTTEFPSPDLSNLRVLIADDNMVSRKITCEMLRVFGVAAESVENGEEVLKALERSVYDVVFLDVQMPVMDGLQAAREITRRFFAEKKPHLVALTAYARESDRARCLDAGMNDYMTKPFDLEMLASKLQHVVVRRRD